MEMAIGFQATPKASFCRTTNPSNPVRTSNSSPSLHFQREILGRSISSSSAAKPHRARSSHIHHQAIRCSLTQAIKTKAQPLQTKAGPNLENLGLCHGTWMTEPDKVRVLEQCIAMNVSANISSNSQTIKIMLMLSTRGQDDKAIIHLLKEIESSVRPVEVVLVVPSRVDTGNKETPLLKYLGESPDNVKTWAESYLTKNVTCVCLGALSELSTASNDQNQLTLTDFEKALDNLRKVTTAKVSTMVDVTMLSDYSPTTDPSNCKFDEKYEALMKEKVIPDLIESSTPIFHNIFPYFTVNDVPLINCILSSDAGPIPDNPNTEYVHVYDVMFDSIYYAMKDAGSDDEEVPVDVVSGWPTVGSKAVANRRRQAEYIVNLNRHVNEGTPAKPKEFIMNYVNCLVDQDQDPRSEVEWKNFGIV